MNTIPYLYRWIHIPTGMWYIGSKTQKGWDPTQHEKYLCSSKIVKPLILENRNEWHYEILVIGNAKYIRELETKYLLILDAKNNPSSFNQSNACFDPGNRLGRKETVETRKKKSLARQGNKNPSYGKRGKLSPLYGRKDSDETKQKKSIKLIEYNKIRPNEHNKNISKALKGNPNVGLKKERNPSWGRPEVADRINKLPPKTCPYCDKTVSIGNYARWHGSNCKKIIRPPSQAVK